jgi:hypothetical protein
MNHKPPKEEGGADDAARSKSTDVQAILDDFRKINGAAAPVWSAEGWRLYRMDNFRSAKTSNGI